MVIPTYLYDHWIMEDVGPFDSTTFVLGIGEKKGKAEVILRNEGVVCGLEEAKEIYLRAGAERVELVAEEGDFAKGVVLIAYGKAEALHKAWRVAQNAVAIASGVATYTRRMVEALKEANTNAKIVVARKAPPCRALYYKGVICGGAALHRSTLSDTILVFKNHLVFTDLKEAIKKMEESPFTMGRKVVFEVDDIEDAIEVAKHGFDVQVDHVSPKELKEIIEKVKAINPNVKVYVGGGIDISNIKDYAIADGIVTSAPYWAKPLDVTTRMTPLE